MCLQMSVHHSIPHQVQTLLSNVYYALDKITAAVTLHAKYSERQSRGLASHAFDILKMTCPAVICTRSGIDNQTHNSQEKIHNTSKHGQK